MKILPVLLKDGYKVGHFQQYPSDTTMVYSNLTPRNTRRVGTDNDSIVFFGLQYFIGEYLMEQFNENFFKQDEDEVVAQYKRRIDNYLGVGAGNLSWNDVKKKIETILPDNVHVITW